MHRRVQRLMAAVFAFTFLLSYLIAPVPAASPTPPRAPGTGGPPAAPMPHFATAPVTAPAHATPINLDLTSTARNLPAPQFVQNTPVNILVGGATQAVTPSMVLTPAERLAAYQV